MDRVLSYLDALTESLAQEMERDQSVVVFGEDNIGGTGCDGTLGHAWGPTKGLHEKFPDRVLDAPITEAAFVGAAVGAAATGLRPVADLLFVDFAAWRPTLLVALTIPFALVGGVIGVLLQGGVLGAFMSWGRWAELRLPGAGSGPGWIWRACLIAVGLLLLFYREG